MCSVCSTVQQRVKMLLGECRVAVHRVDAVKGPMWLYRPNATKQLLLEGSICYTYTLHSA